MAKASFDIAPLHDSFNLVTYMVGVSPSGLNVYVVCCVFIISIHCCVIMRHILADIILTGMQMCKEKGRLGTLSDIIVIIEILILIFIY